MSTTVRDLIAGSLRLINVIGLNETPKQSVMDISLQALDAMTDSWSNDRLMIYSITPYIFDLTTGANSYTLGPGGDWNTPRPMKIEHLYARLNNGTLQQLDIGIQPLTDEQYYGIAVKNTTSTFAFAYYDDNSYPLRNITLFPIPPAGSQVLAGLREPLIDISQNAIIGYNISNPGTAYTDGQYFVVPLAGGTGAGAIANITVLNGIITTVTLLNAGENYGIGNTLTVSNSQIGGTGTGFQVTVTAISGNLGSPITYPPGYERAFRYNLAVELAAEFGKTIPQQVVDIAINSKLELQRLNSVPRYLRGDGGMSRSGRNRYFNWITGNFWSFGNN